MSESSLSCASRTSRLSFHDSDNPDTNGTMLEDMNILVVPVIRTRPIVSSFTSSLKSIIPNIQQPTDDDFGMEDASESEDSCDFSANSDYWDKVNNGSLSSDLENDNETIGTEKKTKFMPDQTIDTMESSVTSELTDSRQCSFRDDDTIPNCSRPSYMYSRDYIERQQRLVRLQDEVLGPSKKKEEPGRSKEEKRQIYDLTCLLSSAMELQFKRGKDGCETKDEGSHKQCQLNPVKALKSAIDAVTFRKSKLQWASKVMSVEEDSEPQHE